MAKLLLVWTLFLIICWFTIVSGKIENEGELKSFIKEKVIPTFRTWAKKSRGGGEQFAVLMLMDTDKEWHNFKLLPTPKTTDKSLVQPAADERDHNYNYIAVQPGKIDNQYMHSEQRIYEEYLENMWKKYKEKHHQNAPKAMVLYSWIVPCATQECASKSTKGCTEHTIKALKKYTQDTKVIVAYTTKGGGGKRKSEKPKFTCDFKTTEEKLEKANIDVVRITGKFEKEDEQEAMMENLINRLLQILE